MIKTLLLLSFVIILCAVSPEHSYAQDNNQPIDIIATLDADTPPGNIAIGADGRIFLSIHAFFSQSLRIAELLPDGSTKPYPNEDWAFIPESPNDNGIYDVLGLNVDREGVLWILDTSGADRSGRLIGWDTKAETLHRIIYLGAPFVEADSFLNDLSIDRDHDFVYIADTGIAAILVVNLKTGAVRRVLKGSKVTSAEPIDMVIDGKIVTLGGQNARLGINPITIDHKSEYVYFGAMTGTSVYRVRTADLRDAALLDEDLIKRVERYGDKPISDGITIDDKGYVYITSITDDSLGVTKPDGTYEALVKRDDLSWPDGLAVGPDDYIYATINELHRSPVLNGGENAAKGEFKVIRIKALSEATTGR